MEEHFLNGGLGSAVAQLLALRHPTPMRMAGVDDVFATNGPYEELLGLYGLLPEQIAATARTLL